MWRENPEGSTPQKTFNFDFGDIDEKSLDTFPKTTTVNVTVSGPGDATSTSETLTAKAKVNWHLPPGTLSEFTIEFNPIIDDGAPPDLDDQILMQQEIRQAFAQAPTRFIKANIEAGKIVILCLLPDEYDLLLGVGKIAKIGKIASAIKGAAEAISARKLVDLGDLRRVANKTDIRPLA